MARSGGGGGSGFSRMQQMATDRDTKAQQLIDALDRNTRAASGGGGTGGGGGNAGRSGGSRGGAANHPVVPAHLMQNAHGGQNIDALEIQAHSMNDAREAKRVAGFIGPIQDPHAARMNRDEDLARHMNSQFDAEKSAAPGLGLSAARQMLGMVGATSALSAAAQPLLDMASMHTEARDAGMASPAMGGTFEGRAFNRNFSQGQQDIDFREKYAKSRLLGFGFENGKGFTGYEAAERGNDQMKAFQQQEFDAKKSALDIAQEETNEAMKGLGAAGGFTDGPAGDGARALQRDVFQFRLELAKNVIKQREDLQTLRDHMSQPHGPGK